MEIAILLGYVGEPDLSDFTKKVERVAKMLHAAGAVSERRRLVETVSLVLMACIAGALLFTA